MRGINNTSIVIFLYLLIFPGCNNIPEDDSVSYSIINENTPSRSNYFDWINSEWPGSHQDKVLSNLDFFKWLYKEYGMQLDIYHMDAGNIDRSPDWISEAKDHGEGVTLAYGHIDDSRVREKFPDGFKSIVEKANGINTRMGIWLGPDGYGTTVEEADKRTSMLVDFCRNYNFAVFKFDAACTNLRPENEDKFINTISLCRSYTPDLITLNHRITLSDSAKKQMTTWLWEGKETYIDVHIWNETPAPHHRAGALSRGLPPDLSRLTEDHGVCISSCLDYWDDDLVLQAFSRNLILAPQIYGNPWLLRDDEFPALARIFNIHSKYRDILVNGIIIPEDKYGQHAVSRGNADTRLLTLRNLTWNKNSVDIKLTKEIGLESNKKVLVKQLHPAEKVIGIFEPGSVVTIEIEPFRALLLLITSDFKHELSVTGTNYKVTREMPGSPVEIELLGFPGETKLVGLNRGIYKFKKAFLDGMDVSKLISGNEIQVKFDGVPFEKNFHRRIGILQKTDIPRDWESLYEATCFTADNNALEVRSLKRSGPSAIPQVEKAREMFFSDPTFWKKGIWDKYAFDNDTSTSFKVREYKLKDVQVEPGALRINFGEILSVDRIVLKNVIDTFNVPIAETSSDLVRWRSVPVRRQGSDLIISPSEALTMQYIRIGKTPISISEIEVYSGKNRIQARDTWQISNLFPAIGQIKIYGCWHNSFILDELSGNSYLCIAIPGKYENEGAWSALKIDGKYLGSPDRSPSFISNHWEHVVKSADGNYTYYFPLTEDMKGKQIEVYVLGLSEQSINIHPEVWITSYPFPYKKKSLKLYE